MNSSFFKARFVSSNDKKNHKNDKKSHKNSLNNNSNEDSDDNPTNAYFSGSRTISEKVYTYTGMCR